MRSAGLLTWRRLPSVTTGGKPYFWNAWRNGRRVGSVVWNRIDLAYACEAHGLDYGTVPTVAAGKRLLESVLSNLCDHCRRHIVPTDAYRDHGMCGQ